MVALAEQLNGKQKAMALKKSEQQMEQMALAHRLGVLFVPGTDAGSPRGQHGGAVIYDMSRLSVREKD